MSGQDASYGISDGLGAEYLAKSKSSSGSQDERKAYALFASAEEHLNSENADLALQEAQEALELLKGANADAARLVVHVLCYQGDRKQANKVARDALATFKKSKDRMAEGKMMLSVAQVNGEKRGEKNREDALMMSRDALALFQELREPHHEGMALLTQINIHLRRKGQEKGTLEAQDLSGQARKIFQGIKDRKGEAMALHAMAITSARCSALGLPVDEKGGWLQPAQEATLLFKELGLRKMEVFEQICIANWHLSEKKAQKALQVAKKALTTCRQIGSPLEHAALNAVVQAYIDTKDVTPTGRIKYAGMAVQTAQEGLAQFRARGDMFGEAQALTGLVLAYRARGDTQEALVSAQEALTCFRELGDEASEATMLQLVAQFHMQLDQYEKAYGTAREVSDAAKTHLQKIGALETQYEVHLRRSDWSKAMDVALAIQAILHEAGDKEKEAASMLLVANCHYMQQEYQDAVDVARDAHKMIEGSASSQEEVGVLRVLAELHLANQEPEASLRSAEQALALLQEGNDEDGESSVLFLVAQIRRMLLSQFEADSEGQNYNEMWSAAGRTASAAIALAKKLGNKPLQAAALCTFAQVQAAGMKTSVALNATEEAVAIWRECGEEKQVASALVVEAEVHFAGGNKARAKDMCNKALAISKKHNDERGEWVASTMLMRIDGKKPVEYYEVEEQWEDWGDWQGDWGEWDQGAQQAAPQEQQAVAKPQGQRRQRDTSALDMSNLSEDIVRDRLKEMVMDIIGDEIDEEIELDMPLMQVGVSSRTAVTLRNSMADELPGVNMPFTMVFDYPTIAAMTDMIIENSGSSSLRR